MSNPRILGHLCPFCPHGGDGKLCPPVPRALTLLGASWFVTRCIDERFSDSVMCSEVWLLATVTTNHNKQNSPFSTQNVHKQRKGKIV